MSKVIDWKSASDPRDVVHLAVQAIAEGHIVAVPSDCSYMLLASGLHQASVAQLSQLAQTGKLQAPAVMLRSPAELSDYFPDSPQAIKRFAPKVWPGPISFDLEMSTELSLLSQLENAVLRDLQQENLKVRVSIPSHPLIEQLTRLLAGPLVCFPVLDSKGGLARHVEEIDPSFFTLAVDDGVSTIATAPTQVEFDKSRGRVIREGALPAEYLKMLSRWTVLFVCTGNTCRSPMAQAMMNRKIEEKFSKQFGARDLPIYAISAGVAAYGGDPASPGAQQAIKKYRANLDKHQSNQLTLELVDQADLILTMGSRHKHVIVSQWPAASGKVQMISPDGSEIADPFGGPIEIYARCAEQLDQCTDYWIDRLNVSDLIEWS
ncbi:MAG: Sua5/YciO/YrdC/YwlC family protein [Pirellula sp.]|jgi:protein-tyrosine phosphatase|nr:Sua5/YciO/YrdC/YwlC family protein [Pirellula sp.]